MSDFPSRQLSRLMGMESGPAVWSADDLAAILHHQLAAPLAVDLGSALDSLASAERPGMVESLREMTFGELLAHPRPPIDALRLVKDFGKACRADPAGLLPKQVATVLYYAAIVAAQVRLGANISTIGAEGLRTGIEWAAAQPWVAGPVRALLEEGRARI